MWYFANMSEQEIEDRLVHIVKMFKGIHEDKIELICGTIAILEAGKFDIKRASET